MKFRFITTEDPEHTKEQMLRWEVLLKPQGIPPEMEMSPEEKSSLHLIALDRKNLVGCILFHPENETKGRLYHMALSEEYQGKGFGRKMISTLERSLAGRGIKEVYLETPQDRVGFYVRMGYQMEGNVQLKNGLLQQRMIKKL